MRAIVFALLLCSSALADVKVNETTITGDMHGAVPRFSALYPAERCLIVPEGKTFTLPPTFDYDAIEVSGTLKLSRDYDTTGKFIVITVLPGGSLDFGRQSDPVLRKVDLQVKDVPLLCGTDGALGPDAEQFGNGILVFGEWASYGRALTKTWTTHQPAQAGATTLTLTDAVNWQVGDELLIPDTRLRYDLTNVGLEARTLRHESPVRVKAIDGKTLTLDKPLDFEHLAAGGQLPYLANVTRNIVIRSENPQGTRGHAMFMDTAHVNVYYAAIVGFGRTLPKTLDSLDRTKGHVGTNQIARYAFHWHHVHGHADAQDTTGRIVGCYLDGSDIAKWGIVQHGTHDLLITDNVIDRFVGAGISAEDGFEVRGRWLRNFVAHCKGNGLDEKFNVLNTGESGVQNAPGAGGSAYWLHGSQHTLEDNVAVACAVGFSPTHMNQVAARLVPSQPGGEPDTLLDPRFTVPISFARNVAVNCGRGLETWRTPGGWTASGLLAVNSYDQGIHMGAGEGGSIVLTSSRLINDLASIPQARWPFIRTTGISSSRGYTSSITLDDVEIEGFQDGGIDAWEYSIKNSRLKNIRWNLNRGEFPHDERPLALDNVTFERFLPTTQHIQMGQGGSGPFFTPNLDPSKFFLVNGWNGDGKRYWLWEDFVAPAGAVKLDGLVNAKAVLVGSTPPVEPPPVEPPPTPDRTQQLIDELKALIQKYQ